MPRSPGNSPIRSHDPVTRELVWEGPTDDANSIAEAVGRARDAFPEWRDTPLSERARILRRFAEVVHAEGGDLAHRISAESGKPLWESLTEVNAVAGKIELSIEAVERRCADFTNRGAHTRFCPHGVVAVLGPFNFPAHLPNGHIAPALLAGNSVVFKPSDRTPGTGERLAHLWRKSGLPQGVLEVVQGAGDVGAALAGHPDINGIFFTGSERVGKRLLAAFADHPGKILALEMGGNNPIIAHETEDAAKAAAIIAQSAFISAGQRCTCARRLILIEGREAEDLLGHLRRITATIAIGHFSEDPQPFAGPVISLSAAAACVNAERRLRALGGQSLLGLEQLRPETPLLRPGIIDLTAAVDRPDEEVFGPLLQVIRVRGFDEALAEANRTRFGLAAGLISANAGLYARFRREARAGIINWNHPLTGASSAAPFGGIGDSGNHRPSAYFAADYCAYPVASLERADLPFPPALPGFPSDR